MKLHLPKQLFTALLAAITLTAPAAWGANELNLGNAPGNFYAGNYAFSFQIDENDLDATEDTTDVLALYWGEFNDGNYYTNGITLTHASNGITLYVGDGSRTNAGTNNENAEITESTTFTGSRGATFTSALEVGATYTLVNKGADGAQTVMLLKNGVYQETVTYNGNMHGGSTGSTMYSVWNDDYAPGNVLVWNGTSNSPSFEISNFIGGNATLAESDLIFASGIDGVTTTVNVSGEIAAGSISIYDSYTFNATAATTLSSTNGLFIGAGGSLTLQGETTTLSGTITNNGTLTLSGTNTIAEGTTLTLEGSGSYTGLSTLTGLGDLEIGYTAGTIDSLSSDFDGTLRLIAGGSATIGARVVNILNAPLEIDGGVVSIDRPGDSQLTKSISVSNGGTIKVLASDLVNDEGTAVVDIALTDSTMQMVSSRYTMGSTHTIHLNNSRIEGVGTNGNADYDGDGHGIIDISKTTTITSSGTSAIDGAIRLRSGATLTLALTGELTVRNFGEAGSLIVDGAGTLKMTDMSSFGSYSYYTGNTELRSNATLEYAMAEGTSGSYSGTISGTGNIHKSGAGSVTLSSVNGLDGIIRVNGGSLTINNLTVNRTLAFAISQDETASASLSIGNVTLSSNLALTELDTEVFYVQEKSDSATHTENGFRASSGTYLLFDGFEWNGEIAGYNVTAENSQTKLTSTSTVFSDIFYVNQSAEYSDAALFGSTAVEIAAEQGLTLNVAEGTVNNAAAAVTGSGKLIKTGSGELKLNQTGTYTGGTEIQGGILIVNANNALGSGAVTLGAGTTLELRYGVGLTNDISMTDATLDLLNGSGTYNTLNSNITLAGTRNVIKGSCYGNNTTVAGTITGSGVLSLETSTHPDYNTTAATNQWTISSVISGDSLSLVSSANVTLSGANTFKGNVTITGNTLTLGGSSSGISALGETYDTNKDRTITVQNGATLDVKGKEAYYHVVLEDGATLTNSGNAVNVDRGALPYVELRGDATINSSSQMVMKQGGSDSSGTFQLALNGHKLTKTGANMLYLQNVSIGSGTLQIDAGTVKAGTGVTLVDDAALDLIINDGILHTQASLSLNTLTLGANADEVCVEGNNNTLTVTGATSAAGKFSKTGSGILSLEGATTFGGEVYVTNGRLKVTGALTAGAINKTGGGTLELADGSGEKKINGTSSITNGILVITQQDAIDYTATTSMSISGATLQLDARQTVDSENSFTLSSGHITGSGGDYDSTDASYTAGLDIYNDSTLTINSSGASSIATGIGLRNESGKVKFNVTADTLTTSGAIAGNGGVLKSGAGEMVLSGNNTYTGGTSIEAGTVTAQNASALGTGGVAVSGTGVLSVAENLKLQDTLQLSGAGEVQVATGKSLNLQDKVSMSSTDGTNAATLTAKANVNALAQLQEDASFTIQDMTLTNTTITAATPTTQVKLQNVTASNVVLAKGKFSTNADMAMVGMGGSEGTFSFAGGLTNESITINASAGASLAVDLGDLSCVTAMGPGKYDLSITLSGVTLDSYTGLADGAGITFEGWLGELIGASSGVQVSFSEAVAEETPAAVAEGGAATGVTYSTGSVGTVITITGLNVPEPATSTLSLLALAALAARRRRKA